MTRCSKFVEKIRLIVRHISQKLSFYITFSEVLGVPADNEQNPIFTDIKE